MFTYSKVQYTVLKSNSMTFYSTYIGHDPDITFYIFKSDSYQLVRLGGCPYPPSELMNLIHNATHTPTY